jgi:hypothetical protein
MALRDWTVSRLAVIWAAWLLVLLVGFLVMVAMSPEGVHISISPANARGAFRWMLAIAAGIAVVLPPAIVTYLWYLARLRKWSEAPDAKAKTRAPS